MRTLVVALLLAVPISGRAAADIEFIQEHLPEAAMDNRYATLPVWSQALLEQRIHRGVDRNYLLSFSWAYSRRE